MPQSNEPKEPIIHLIRQQTSNPCNDAYNGVKVFPHGIALASHGYDALYTLENIGDVFLTLNPDDSEKIVAIYTIIKKTPYQEKLFERDFPGLQEAIGQALKNGWGGFYEKRCASNALKWFNALCGLSAISAVRNPYVYAYKIMNPKFQKSEVQRVSRAWRLEDKDALHRDMASQIGQQVAYFTKHHANPNKLKKERLVNAIRVVTLSKLMTSALEGYACDWLTYEESLAWCRVSGKMLQGICDSWDSYNEHMLDTYDIIKNTDGTALKDGFLKTTNQLSQLPEDPRQIPWSTPLDIDIGPIVNAEKKTLPPDFQYMSALPSGAGVSIEAFRKPVQGFAKSVESGENSVSEVKVRLEIAISTLVGLTEKLPYKATELVHNTFFDTVNEIFKFYSLDIDTDDVCSPHMPPISDEDFFGF
ncbi:MAG: DUF1266 domain-containing protein [Clostridiales bacterium]|jgi:hypothetical protein|nr:DUF1266 domain-containing protein [Clostridiales bacterium]